MPGSAVKHDQGIPRGVYSFATTHWSVVLTAARHDTSARADALERLCRTYWFPLYAYVRRQGYSSSDAQDLTQTFFPRLLGNDYLALADRERGRSRTFLITSLKRFLINERQKARTAKRGGRVCFVSWDERDAEEHLRRELMDDLTPERAFEKRWAIALLNQVITRLREEHARDEQLDRFEAMKDFLWGERQELTYAKLGEQIGLSEGAARVTVHRLRRRFRQLLRNEIAHTVARPDEIDDELRHLMNAVQT